MIKVNITGIGSNGCHLEIKEIAGGITADDYMGRVELHDLKRQDLELLKFAIELTLKEDDYNKEYKRKQNEIHLRHGQ